MHDAIRNVVRTAWHRNSIDFGARALLAETEISLTIDDEPAAAITATPRDLEDLAIGYCRATGLISSISDIASLEVVEGDTGVSLGVRLNEARTNGAGASPLADCSQQSALPTDSMSSSATPMQARPATGEIISPCEIIRARETVARQLPLKRQSCGAHAAAFWQPIERLVALREDVTCVNALDKLAGALLQLGTEPRWRGIALLTGNVSVQLVQKAATLQIPFIVSEGAPTTLAVKRAEEAGITLVAHACNDSFEIYSHSGRISNEHIARIA